MIESLWTLILLLYIRWRRRRQRAATIDFLIGDRVVQTTTFKNNQGQDVALRFKNSAGQEVSVDGIPQWSVDDTSICQVEPAGDGLSARIVSVGGVGTTNVRVTADADVGPGFSNIEGVLEVTVTESGAVMVEFVLGNVFDRPTV